MCITRDAMVVGRQTKGPTMNTTRSTTSTSEFVASWRMPEVHHQPARDPREAPTGDTVSRDDAERAQVPTGR